MSKHFYGRKKITFGIVPFTNKGLDEILEIKYDNRVFFVERMYEQAEQELQKRYKNICTRCEQEDIDFLVFPEMLMTENIISSIRGTDKSLSSKIVVNGSVWKNCINKTIVTDGTGKDIFSYCKKEPFEFEKEDIIYREYLDQNENKEYVIMEIEGLGRIGVAICKDLLSEEVKLFHKCIGTNVLIVPAYTNSMDLQSSAEGLSKEYNCVVVVANACSALGPAKEKESERRVGFITLPAKCDTDRAGITLMYTQNDCIEECEHTCVGKKMTIDFYTTKEYKEGLSYEIREGKF